jgi:hypothetical protein
VSYFIHLLYFLQVYTTSTIHLYDPIFLGRDFTLHHNIKYANALWIPAVSREDNNNVSKQSICTTYIYRYGYQVSQTWHPKAVGLP